MWTVIVSILFLHRFTRLAVCLFQVREFLGKLDELTGKVSYPNDPIKIKKPALQQRMDKLLHDLLKRSPVHGHTNHPPLLLCNCCLTYPPFYFLFPLSSFVVESQPSMPQGKGALVLRTNVQFSVKTRLVWNYRAVAANLFLCFSNLLVSLILSSKKLYARQIIFCKQLQSELQNPTPQLWYKYQTAPQQLWLIIPVVKIWCSFGFWQINH